MKTNEVERFEKLKKKLDTKKNELIRAQANIDHINAQIQKLWADLEVAHGISTVEELENTIQTITAELNEKMDHFETLLAQYESV